jgi:hypothetical protein
LNFYLNLHPKKKIPKSFVATEQEFTQKTNADESTIVNGS